MTRAHAVAASVLLYALLLTACGGGNPEPDEADQPAQVIGDKAIPTAPSASASK